MGSFSVKLYEPSMEDRWDSFVLNNAYNGTFLQTRNFLNYHPVERFNDSSLVIFKGESEIAAVVPASVIEGEEGKIFLSHPGSTFGGLVIGESLYSIRNVGSMLDVLEEYLRDGGFSGARLKQSSQIFSAKSNDLLEYLFFQRGWNESKEISFVIDFNEYDPDVLSNFTSSRRRDFRYAAKNDLTFRELASDEEIESFYGLLCDNLQKYDAIPVHTLAELMEFKNSRLTENVAFYGVFAGDTLVAASMVFLFRNQVFHTQYLSASPDHLDLFPSNYLDTKLIEHARDAGFRFFSFGISTEENGKNLNESLAIFKEGFGTSYSNNKAFEKMF